MGDVLSDTVLAAADDLYHMRIPDLWRNMSGDTAPPPNYNITSWLTDLTSRCQHFERILVHVSYILVIQGVGLQWWIQDFLW